MSMSKTGLIIQREFKTRVRKPGFIAITLLVPFLIVGAIALLAVFMQQDEKHYKVLVADPRGLCQGEIFVGANENPPATFFFLEEMLSVEDFRYEQRFLEYDMMVALDQEVVTNRTINIGYRVKPLPSAELYIRKKLELRLEEYFAKDKGMNLKDYRDVRQPLKIAFMDLEDAEGQKLAEQARILGYLFSIFIFLFIVTYSAMVLRSVLEEKTSRIVEIVVSSVKPMQLMVGKILGVGLVGILQFSVWIIMIVSLLAMMRAFVFPDITTPEMIANLNEQGIVPGMSEFDALTVQNDFFNLLFRQINWGLMITLFLIYFLGGYLFYAGLFAMVGAASDSETDSQQLLLPIILPLVFVIVLSTLLLINPGGQVELWFSQLPFSSPMIMLQRVASGTVSFWEVLVSIGLLIIGFLVIFWIAAKVYRVGILMYGKRAGWKEIMRWMRY